MKKGYVKCPFCANEIKEGAVKCQFCEEFLDGRSKKQDNVVNKIKKISFRFWIIISIILIGIIGLIVRFLVRNNKDEAVLDYHDKIIETYYKCYDTQNNIMGNYGENYELISYEDIDYILKTCEEARNTIFEIGGYKGDSRLMRSTNEVINSITTYYTYYKQILRLEGKQLTEGEKYQYNNILNALEGLEDKFQEALLKLKNTQADFMSSYGYEE